MSQAIGDMLPFAVALAIGSAPNIVVMLLLTSSGGRVRSVSFIAGWMVGVLATGAIVLAIADPADPGDASDPAPWVSWLKLVLALLLVAYAVKSWMTRPGPEDEPVAPGWMATLENVSPGRAAITGISLASFNPKSVAFVVGGVTAIAVGVHAVGDQVIALLIFAVIGSLGVLLPPALVAVRGQQGVVILTSMRDWMMRNNAAIMGGVMVMVGAQLLGDAISGLFG